VRFPGVATLVGADVPEVITPETEITLVWQAEAPEIDYTVFVQVLSPDGRVIAQSDQMPARPTSGWIEDEYIVDTHRLRFNLPDYDGPGTVIAGFYDAAEGFRRVMTADSTDRADLPVDVVVD
jgi:hypothetical protein